MKTNLIFSKLVCVRFHDACFALSCIQERAEDTEWLQVATGCVFVYRRRRSWHHRSRDKLKAGSDLRSYDRGGKLTRSFSVVVCFEMKSRFDTWHGTNRTIRGITGGKKRNQCAARHPDPPPRTWSGLCTTTVFFAFSSRVGSVWSVPSLWPPTTMNQKRRTGGWLWKLSVMEYTRSTRTWTQH